MRKGILTLLTALLPLAMAAQDAPVNDDGKRIEKDKMETKDYLPEVHGTIRAKYEYQTGMQARPLRGADSPRQPDGPTSCPP